MDFWLTKFAEVSGKVLKFLKISPTLQLQITCGKDVMFHVCIDGIKEELHFNVFHRGWCFHFLTNFSARNGING